MLDWREEYSYLGERNFHPLKYSRDTKSNDGNITWGRGEGYFLTLAAICSALLSPQSWIKIHIVPKSWVHSNTSGHDYQQTVPSSVNRSWGSRQMKQSSEKRCSFSVMTKPSWLISPWAFFSLGQLSHFLLDYLLMEIPGFHPKGICTLPTPDLMLNAFQFQPIDQHKQTRFRHKITRESAFSKKERGKKN